MKTKSKLRAGVTSSGGTKNFNHNQKRLRSPLPVAVRIRSRVAPMI